MKIDRKIKRWWMAVLAFCLVFGMFGGTASGATARYAVVKEVIGDVTVAKAGGALSIPVVTGMMLHEGDRIATGSGGYLVLETDRKDEITIGENWRGTLSMLRTNARGGSDTAVKTWAGSIYNRVSKLSDTASTFRVETPGTVTHVKGTHFMITIDPRTGLPKMTVNAGIVRTGSGSPADPGIPLYPSQQVTLYAGSDRVGIEYLDPSDLTVSIDGEVIAKMLKNKALIDEENEELLGSLEELDEDGILNRLDEETLERYKTNVEYMLVHMLKMAYEQGKLDELTMNDIITAANQSIQDVNRKYDLERDIPPIDRSAGIDPEVERARQEEREQARQQAQERQNQKEEKRESVRERNAELQERIEQQQNEQKQANEQAQEEKQTNTLTEEQRQALEERLREKKEQGEQRQREREAANQPPSPSPSPPSGPSSPSPAATTTTVELSETEIVYGQTFTMTAEVQKATSGAVPDGGRVDFRIGSATIGSATISGGTATLTVDETVWANEAMSALGIGQHTVTAAYAGSGQQIAGSTSPGVELDIAKADAVVNISVSPNPPQPGDVLEVLVTVTAKPPGGGKPAGSVTLYRLANDQWQPVDEPLPLDPGTGSVTFQDSFLKDTGAVETVYMAEFASSDGRHNDGVSEEAEAVVQLPKPVVYIDKVLETEWSTYLTISIDLANFSGDHAFSEAELRFAHHLIIDPDHPDMQTEGYDVILNYDKFDDPGDYAYSFQSDEENDWQLVFQFSSNRDGGFEFGERDRMVDIYINFRIDISDIDDTLELVHLVFKKQNGDTIDVEVKSDTGVIFHLSE